MTLSHALLLLAAAGLGRGLSRERGGLMHRHDCRFSTWVDGYGGPDGAPCSRKCREDRALVELIGRYLHGELREAELPRQLRLLEAS